MEYSLEDAKLSVGVGWHSLIDELYAQKPKETLIEDIKEKYGGLRVSYYDGTPEFSKLVDDLESRSLGICEVCGQPGSPSGSWIKTLCEEHTRTRNTYLG